VGGWSLHLAADGVHHILTLSTPDGFEVSFALGSDAADDLAASLGERRRGQARQAH
jgi:hypothetical protein